MTNFMGFSEFFMQNPILVLTLLAHVLADFQLQSQTMADLKSRRMNFLILHLGIVLLPLLLLGLILPNCLLYFALVWFSHALIDFLKNRLNSLIVRHHAQKLAFILDQILHLISIFALYFLLGQQIPVPNWLSERYLMLQALFFFALTGKPINILFKLFFSKYQAGEDTGETIAGAGAMIGILERLIMGLSLIFGQFTAIGLVFTAKSIARYNKISESQSFAEYYLIGSLFSMIAVLLVYGCLYW
ncbi:DUF3307 domain-containing protein [Streptococcus sanguinis]|uniref:DUF3307 domain-containing protein n=1 Tax=Streptococcus sanguinis SK353 TaxID=888815 RepID=F0FDT5_STRSA|nr:DUF3307 domain-containing protein [Streptococcus sanguinis]EGC22770.1 hypothetical protein HMPREF9388_0867 [Streptococcus sanguinis SK353]